MISYVSSVCLYSLHIVRIPGLLIGYNLTIGIAESVGGVISGDFSGCGSSSGNSSGSSAGNVGASGDFDGCSSGISMAGNSAGSFGSFFLATFDSFTMLRD